VPHPSSARTLESVACRALRRAIKGWEKTKQLGNETLVENRAVRSGAGVAWVGRAVAVVHGKIQKEGVKKRQGGISKRGNGAVSFGQN